MRIRPFGAPVANGHMAASKVSFKTDGYEAQLSQSPLEALCALEQWRIEEQGELERVRWSRETMPLLVFYAAPKPSVAISASEFASLVSQAIKQWEIAGQGLIYLQLTPFQNKADINIGWTDQTTLGRDYEVGHTDRHIDGQWIQKGDITLIEAPQIDRHLSPVAQQRRLYSTLLHELGHALGLEHSNAKQDLMHHQGWRNTVLSPNDIEQLQHLYRSNRLQWL